MDKSTYPRVGQVNLPIGRVVFKNTAVFRKRRTFFLDLGLNSAVIVWSIGGGVLLGAFGGGAFGTAAREVKDELFFFIILVVGILCEVYRAPFIAFFSSPSEEIIFGLL